MNEKTLMGQLEAATVEKSVIDGIEATAKEVLDKYNYEYGHGLREAIETGLRRKAQLITLFRRNENWNEEKLQIQFSKDYNRGIDLNQVERFFSWAKDELSKKVNNRQVKIGSFTFREVKRYKEKLERLVDEITGIEYMGYRSVQVNGFNKEHFRTELRKFNNLYNKFLCMSDIKFDNETCISNADYELKQDLLEFSNVVICYLTDNKETENVHLLGEEICTRINNIFPDVARKGMKLSKVIRKVCGEICGLQDVVNMKDNSFWDNNGNWVERQKDMGWNYQFAMVADSINPYKIKRHTIISLNFVDFLCMSFGHNWASCMDISRGKFANCDCSYEGQYSGGTVSLGADPSSVVFYTVDEKYNGTDFEFQPKMQRAIFALGDDAMYEGRVYPDGRDGGDDSLAGQFRTIMQKIVADALDVPNMWDIKKGTSPCCNTLESMYGAAYSDWASCSDSVMSYLRHPDTIDIESRKIQINAPQICLCCGDIHDRSENILCTCCSSDYFCDHCGTGIDEEEAIWIEGADAYFCCEECANEAGWYIPVDGDWGEYYHESDLNYDDYSGEYFIHTGEMVVTEDGYTYMDSENAHYAGYVYCENADGWYKERECHIDEGTGEYYYPDSDEVIIDGKTYMSEDTAIDDGYIYDEESEEWRAA